jgi:hypothetical protein
MGFLAGSLMLMQMLGAATAGILTGMIGIGTALGTCSLAGVLVSMAALVAFRRLPADAREDLDATAGTP